MNLMEGDNMVSMNIEFTSFAKGQNWVTGVVNNGEYTFSSKLFEEGSQYGINDGRVSKLSITEESKRTNESWFSGVIVNYDRGWDIEPSTDKEIEIYEAVLEFLENAPKTRF